MNNVGIRKLLEATQPWTRAFYNLKRRKGSERKRYLLW